MSCKLNRHENAVQEQSREIERFALFKFSSALTKGIKNSIKSHGCQWNALFRGWLCPIAKQKAVQKAIQEVNVVYETSIISLPKGAISTDPKIVGRQSRLDILEEEVYQEDRQLLVDVYHYNKSLRPEDFDTLPKEEDGKTTSQVQVEKGFHERWMISKKKKEEVEKIRKELTELNLMPSEKILDPAAPLLTVDYLIQQHFLYQGHRTLQYCSDAFWKWNGIQYIAIEKDEIRQIVYNFLRDAKEISAKGDLKSFNPNKHKVDKIVDALRSICYLRHHPTSGAIWLDERKEPNPQYLISFKNGILPVIDWLKDSKTPLIPHTSSLLNVNSLSFDFDPAVAEPKEWLWFLNRIWPDDFESQQALREWMGYTLTQDTKQHKILLIVGPPRSGKGTIGRILRELLGHFNVVGPTLSSLGGEFGLQPLLGKMLALISDARLNSKGSNSVIIERLLSISGEDALTVSRKFLPSLTTQLPTRIIMMSNELPDMRDSSGALAKRYLALILKKSWLGNEDTSLFNRLKAELPGILLWALQGLVSLQERGSFVQPASSKQTIEELEAITSPIKAFIAERCDIQPQASIAVSMLFDEWRAWCASTGYSRAGNVQVFGKNLRAAFPDIEMIRPQGELTRERCYKGIRII